jgi:hypothetical protein
LAGSEPWPSPALSSPSSRSSPWYQSPASMSTTSAAWPG